MQQLDARLRPVLIGEERVTGPDEQVSLARMCLHYKHMYATAAVFYGDAFAVRPELANDLALENRFDAARAAVLAGTGQGEDNSPLSNLDRQTWRERARNWLKENLADLAKLAASDKVAARQAARYALLRWKQERDLRAVRNKEALEKLAEGERVVWQKFWDEVDAVLQQTRQKK